MSGFSTTTVKVATSDGRNVTLLEGFSYTTKNSFTYVKDGSPITIPAGIVIEVPAGATSDGASTPRPIWSELPPFGRYWLPCVLHDELYRSTSYPKEFCDHVLLEAMESLGVHAIVARAIYEGVALGGKLAFDQDRAALAAASAIAAASATGAAGAEQE